MCTAAIGCSWLSWCDHIYFVFHLSPFSWSFFSSLFSTPPSSPYLSFLLSLRFTSPSFYPSPYPLSLLFPSLQPDSSVVTFWDALRRATRMRDMFSLQFCPPLDIPLLDITEPRGGTMVCVCMCVCVGECVGG